MDELFEKSLRAAVVAGWQALVLAVVFFMFSWFAFVAFIHLRPAWVLALWGGGEMTWSTIQAVSIWFFGGAKLVLLFLLLANVFLALWLRQLRRAP